MSQADLDEPDRVQLSWTGSLIINFDFMSKTTRISQKDDSMNKLSLEKYFTAIKEDIDEFKQEFIDFRKEVIERFDKQDRILKNGFEYFQNL